MKTSPFPGMDPWLESRWGDVHTSLITYTRDQIQPQLPGSLHAHIEEYVSVEFPDDAPERVPRFEPDVRVVERSTTMDEGGVAVAEAVVARPLIVRLRREPETQRRIRIVDSKSGDRLVTSIEFLSKTNKVSDEGRKTFLNKQNQMRKAGVNLVEIDLLRAGGWAMSVSRSEVPMSYQQPYRICVVRASALIEAEIYEAQLTQPLPTILVPLRDEDEDVRLNLQSLINTAYVNGGYSSYLDYTQPPEPPLDANDAEWAEQILGEHQAKREESLRQKN